MTDDVGKPRVVLGIDAAWTEREPSGIALIADDGTGWRLIEAAASYSAFLEETRRSPTSERHRGSVPDPAAILERASRLAGSSVDLVAVDMPLSMSPIVGRRSSDNLVSSAYGAKHAGTHSPSSERPGRLSDDLRIGFEALGYHLATSPVRGRALVEVYPHPALIELANSDRRLPYKHSKIAKYWPEVEGPVRRTRLLEIWSQIVRILESRVRGVEAALTMPPAGAPRHEMKAFEDRLDAVVCAWVGACIMEGQAMAFGDEQSAIWIPIIR